MLFKKFPSIEFIYSELFSRYYPDAYYWGSWEVWSLVPSPLVLETPCECSGGSSMRVADRFSEILDMSSDEALSTVRVRIEDCESNHKCYARAVPSQVPTRLIDVSIDSNTSFRVVNTADEAISDPYMTLSHRWGDVSFLKLTVTNIALLHAGQSLNTLPQTFRDAIKICRFLGIRYLWIDSPCIIQEEDDLED